MNTRRYAVHSEDEESYFASMTDVVIGLLFVFIIMLMFFAMRFQQATQQQDQATQQQKQATQQQIEVTERQKTLIDDLTDSEAARSEILQSLGERLQKEGIIVSIIKEEGILRFPEEILFEKSSWDLNAKGAVALKALARALDVVLPCYTVGSRSRTDDCPNKKARAQVEAIFIEGHADSDPYRNPANGKMTAQAPPGGKRSSDANVAPSDQRSSFLSFLNKPTPAPGASSNQADQRRPSNLPPKDNLDLSALRATSTFRELLKVLPDLSEYKSPDGKAVLSVSGYGEHRPVARAENEALDKFKQRNRRIDLRILMAATTADAAKKRQIDLQSSGSSPP
jgi:flagellar motor protein MotB